MTTPHERLEQAMWDLFWVPSDVTVVDRPDLLMIHCPRPVAALNTVLRAAGVDALVAESRALHAHGTSRWWVTDNRPTADLELALERGGYAPGHRHDARGIEVERFRPPPPSGEITVVQVDSVARLRQSIAVGNEAFGHRDLPSDEQLAHDVAACTGPAARVHRYVAHDGGGAPVAAGNMTSFPAQRLGLLWGGGTVPSARGRGAYSALLATRLARARELGLTHVGLYARVTTSSPIVARLGFERWGEMTYWELTSGRAR